MTFLSHTPHVGRLFRALLLLGTLWWAWSAYAWLTNTLDPEEGAGRAIALVHDPVALGCDSHRYGLDSQR